MHPQKPPEATCLYETAWQATWVAPSSMMPAAGAVSRVVRLWSVVLDMNQARLHPLLQKFSKRKSQGHA